MEELLADISTDERPLTSEILTAAGWDDLVNISTYKVYKKTIFDPSVKISYWIKVILHLHCERITIDFTDKNAVGKIFTKPITVGEFNTLLDIVKLEKFKIK